MLKDEILAWCMETYDTVPDHPWAKYPENAVLRGKSGKWYGLIMPVPRDKLKLPGNDNVDVLNVKCDSNLIGSLRQKEGFLPAYHMNKENWISILLDGTVPEAEIRTLIDLSYQMTQKK